MAAPTSDFSTVVRNVSGATRFFGYLPPYGKELTTAGNAGSDYECPGDLVTWLYNHNRIGYNAFIYDVYTASPQVLQVMKSPSVVIQDSGNNRVYTITSANGTLATANATDGSYGGPQIVQ